MLGFGLRYTNTTVIPTRRGPRFPRFNPLSLFANDEPGFFLTASPDTCFTDTAGTTNAGPGDAVALWLDQSRGLVPGPELATNGTFDDGLNHWTIREDQAEDNVFLDDGSVVIEKSALTGVAGVIQTFGGAMPAGTTFEASFELKSITGSNVTIRLVQTSPFFLQSVNFSSPGTYKIIGILPEARTNGLRVEVLCIGAASRTVVIDNVSVRELPGAHATQATLASRPILGRKPEGGRRNLLLHTEDLTNAAWVSSTSPDTIFTLLGDGFTRIEFTQPSTDRRHPRRQNTNVTPVTGQKRLITGRFRPGPGITNIALGVASGGGVFSHAAYDITTGAWTAYFVSNPGPVTGISADEVSPGVWDIAVIYDVGDTPCPQIYATFGVGDASDLRFNSPTGFCDVTRVQAVEGQEPTPYQRVTTAFDVTEAGKPDRHYLFFGGSADPRWMQTPTITPGTDKAQVFAGVRKLSDAAIAVVVEASINSGNFDGTLAVFAPVSVSTNYGFRSGGTTRVLLSTAAAFSAPRSDVLTAVADIAGPSATFRVSSVQTNQTTASQGTGNFLAYPAFIGTRNGGGVFLNGEISTLTARFGPNLTTEQIEQMEAFAASKVAEDTI